VGLRRRRTLLRRDRLGHPQLRPDPTRPGYRRDRARRGPAGRSGHRSGLRQVRPAQADRRRDRRPLLPDDEERGRSAGEDADEVRQRHRACACIWTATGARAWAVSSSARTARSKSTATRSQRIPRNCSQGDDNPGPSQGARERAAPEELGRVHQEPRAGNADIEYGQRSSTLCYLVNIAREVGQVGKKLKWDPEAEQFTNCDEGNNCSAARAAKGTSCRPRQTAPL
jgi:hypothetical protein